MSRRIYLDWAATTTTRPEVIEVMVPLLAGSYNASSLHADGRAARGVIDDARASVAAILGARPREIIFTGSGSEADGLAMTGAARARAAHGRHIIVTAIEHRAVLAAAEALEADGWTVTALVPNASGIIAPEAVAAAVLPGTTLASIGLGNNEIGSLQALPAIAAVLHSRSVLLHTDAVQAAGYVDLNVDRLGVDLMTLAAHKFGGPKGVGMLYVRTGTPIAAQLLGGGQEHGLRAGTEDVAGIAGAARALMLAESDRPAVAEHVAALRDRFEHAVLAQTSGTLVLGAGRPRLPHISALAFERVSSDALLIALDLEGVSASAGSACASGSLEPSHVVAALGVPESHAAGMVRFSFGWSSQAADVERAASIVGSVVQRARAVSM